MPKALIVIDHGSRRPSAHQELLDLVKKLSEMRPEIFVKGAHLELAEPSFPQVLDEVIEELCFEAPLSDIQVQVLPWFLASGRHLNGDIPELIEAAHKKYPQVSIQLVPHLGSSEQLLEIAWKLSGI